MTETPTLPPGQETAIACLVAPENVEDVIAAMTPQEQLRGLWWIDELIRRAHAYKKGLQAELAVSIGTGELTDPRIAVNGHTWLFKQDSKTEFDDVPMLLQELANLGFKPYSLGKAVGYVRITSLQEIIREVTQDEDIRKAAYDLIEEHRSRKPTGYALVDLDSPYRHGGKK